MDTLIFESYQIQNLELFTAMHKYINENIIELEDNVSTFNVMLEAKKVKWWEAVKAWFKQIFTLIGKLFAAIFLGKKYKITEIAKDSQKAIEKLQKEQAESGQIVLTANQQQQLLQSQIKKQQLLSQIKKALPAPSLNKADQQKNLIDTKFNEYIDRLQKEYNKRIKLYQASINTGKPMNLSNQNAPVERDIQIGIQGNSQDGKSGWVAYCKKMIESLTQNQNVIPEVEIQISSIETTLLYSLKVFQLSIKKVASVLMLLNTEVNLSASANPLVKNTELSGVSTKIMNYHQKNFIDNISNFYKSLFKIYTNLWTAILILDPLNSTKSKPLKLDKVEPITQKFQTNLESKYNDFKQKHNSSDIDKLYGNNVSKAISYIFKKLTDPVLSFYFTNSGFNTLKSESNFYDCDLSTSESKYVRNDAYVWFDGLVMLKDNNNKYSNNLISNEELMKFTNNIQLCLKNIADFEMFIMTLLEYCKQLLQDPIICAS